jgi:hypothetical protein
MPYVKQEDRLRLLDDLPRTPGELNYEITLLISKYWDYTGNYQGINDIVGALEGAKLEFYRRVAAPYEDKKIAENGDVY